MKTSILCMALFAALPAFAGPITKNAKNVAPVNFVPERVISYSNISARWLHTELDDDGGDHGDGVGAAIEYAVASNFYISAGGWWQNEKYDEGDVDGAGGQVGLGFHFPLCKSADLVLEAGGVYEQYSDDGGDEFGVYASPHLRMLLGPVEAHAGVFYTSTFGGDWSGFVDVFIPIVRNVDLVLGGNLGDEYWGFSVGARMRF